MKHTCTFSMVLLLAASLHAAEDAKPASLTPKEIADGWISLFDGETLYGWREVGEGGWTIAEGMLAPQKGNTGALVTTTAFADYELMVKCRSRKDTKARVLIACDHDGKSSNRNELVDLAPPIDDDWLTIRTTVEAGKITSQAYQTQKFGKTAAVKSSSSSSEQPRAVAGHIALNGEHFVIRSIKLRPFANKALFNGKDLTGWKEVPGKKTKFSVTKDGYLELKDGPGDLQTEGEWADFVLQIDCLCNGDRLNSGVFFRCRPGEFWQGYESQIHNGFDENKPKEYTLEGYDPKTHELKGKRKEMYAATDYGTGGIYNRQPARKQACKDREWFTMTVVAQGRHIGVWVNGVMVTDWTDYRPLSDNARKGCRLEKGTIGLQGHDPTTDLNFRNIRIAELPAVSEPEPK